MVLTATSAVTHTPHAHPRKEVPRPLEWFPGSRSTSRMKSSLRKRNPTMEKR